MKKYVAQSLKDIIAKLISSDDKPNDALILTETVCKYGNNMSLSAEWIQI